MPYRILIKSIILFSGAASSATASPIMDEVLLNISRVKGSVVYTTCILTPPTTPVQVAACVALYGAYVVSLQALNAPFPLVPTTTLSPYIWSPYDVCKYEPTHFVFNIAVTQPYCPATLLKKD
ncbi:MAG: hypothetical protein K0R49_318 [Burkholderiales bacterium]|jgi:hypothetical protein|nr:hypothetical protein [Burkholderiales bacterium]